MSTWGEIRKHVQPVAWTTREEFEDVSEMELPGPTPPSWDGGKEEVAFVVPTNHMLPSATQPPSPAMDEFEDVSEMELPGPTPPSHDEEGEEVAFVAPINHMPGPPTQRNTQPFTSMLQTQEPFTQEPFSGAFSQPDSQPYSQPYSQPSSQPYTQPFSQQVSTPYSTPYGGEGVFVTQCYGEEYV